MSNIPGDDKTNNTDLTTIYEPLDAIRREIRILLLLPPDKKSESAYRTKSNGKPMMMMTMTTTMMMMTETHMTVIVPYMRFSLPPRFSTSSVTMRSPIPEGILSRDTTVIKITVLIMSC